MNTTSARKLRRIVLGLVMINVAGGLPALQADTPRAPGDARLLAQVPDPPGFPEGVVVLDDRVYVAGPATFGTTGKPASQVLAYDRATGALERTFQMRGEDILTEHANSSLAADGSGRLYVLNTQLGVVRIDPATGSQVVWGDPLPDLPPCTPFMQMTCSPTVSDNPPLPNDLAFDSAGNLFVTDSMQATVWAYRPTGGEPVAWYQDQRMASAYIGVNGLRVNPAETHVYYTVSVDLVGESTLYRVPRISYPTPADAEVVHRFQPGDLPDGIAFGVTGLVYVAMATPNRSGIAVIDLTGAMIRRYSNPEGSPFFPYDSPANIAFDGTGAAVLTNHAFVSGAIDGRQFSVLDVYLEDSGAPLATPAIG